MIHAPEAIANHPMMRDGKTNPKCDHPLMESWNLYLTATTVVLCRGCRKRKEYPHALNREQLYYSVRLDFGRLPLSFL